MSELKPCPFCEGEAEIKGRARYWVECGKCFTTTDMYITVEQAIDAWNTRAELTCCIIPMDEAGNPPYRKGDLIMNSLSDGCSKCGYPFDTLNHGIPNYCSNCGRKVNTDANE